MRECRRGRRGFLLIEVGAAAFVLAVILVLTVRLLGWGSVARVEGERRRVALNEAQNVLERLATLPVAELTPERVAALDLDAHAKAALPGGQLAVQLEAQDGPPAGARIRVEVRWRDRSGELTAPLRLTTWTYATGEAPQ